MCRYCLEYKNSDFDIAEAFKVHETARGIGNAFIKHEKALLKLKSLVNDKGVIKAVDTRHKDVTRQRKRFNTTYYQEFLL